jgi:hypothetical protein
MLSEMSDILRAFSSCFHRAAAFHWFVVIIFGLIVRLDFHGVTSFIRWLEFQPNHYESLLKFFRASSWRLADICRCWLGVVRQSVPSVTIQDSVLLVGDGIKIVKEAKFMPGVKSLHQDSDNSGKAPFIFGHHFGTLGLLAGTKKTMFCIPLKAELHEGVETLRNFQGKPAPEVDGEKSVTLVTLMMAMATETVRQMSKPCMLILDAFFAVGSTFLMAQECVNAEGKRLLHVITRAKGNVTAYKGVPSPAPSEKRSKGRPPVWGEKVHLADLFSQRVEQFQTVTLNLYGKDTLISYLCVDLLWKPARDKIRFVLVKDNGERFILMCSRLDWSPGQIIEAYSYRFKIELTFKRLKHLLGTYSYHFWTSAMPKRSKKMPVDWESITDKNDQTRIAQTSNAIEAFVNFGCIALGSLQILALKYSSLIWGKYSGWLRTRRSDIPSEEIVRSVIQKSFYHNFRSFKHTAIFQIISSKQRDSLCLYSDKAA